ncbi:TK protein kinase [Aphelenchoides avenae]|nr:TK protein kinase [Aphelenchus avenae]
MSPEAFLNEAQAIKQCEHANLVKLYAVCTTEEPFYLVTEFMPNGALLGYLRNACHQLSIQAMVGICAQVASGMQFLEERKLVHRDLSARNGLQNREVVEQVKLGYRMPCPKNCPEVLYNELMLECWNTIPEKRPTFAFLSWFLDNYTVNLQPPGQEYPM